MKDQLILKSMKDYMRYMSVVRNRVGVRIENMGLGKRTGLNQSFALMDYKQVHK